MKQLTLPVLLLCAFATSSYVSAEETDPCGCNAALVDGVYNFRASNGDDSAQEAVAKYIARTDYDEVKRAMEASGGGSFAGYGLSGGTSKLDYEKKQHEYRNQYSDWRTSTSSRQLLERYGDSNVLNAWATCKAQCHQHGLHCWVDTLSKNYYTVHLNWIPEIDSRPLITDSTLLGADSLRKDVPKGKLIEPSAIPVGETTIPIERKNPGDEILVHVSVAGGLDRDAFVPGWIPPKEAPAKAKTGEGYKDIILCTGDANANREESPGYRGNLAGIAPKDPRFPADGSASALPAENLPTKAAITGIEPEKTQVLYEESGTFNSVQYNHDKNSETKGYLVRVHTTKRDLLVQGWSLDNSNRRVKIRVWFTYEF